jgi:sporulation protein YlmC with PRC-barrel domain
MTRPIQHSLKVFSIAALSLLAGGAACPSIAQYSQTQHKAPPPQAEQTAPAPAVTPVPPPGSQTNSDWRAGKLIGATMSDTLGNSIGKVEDIVIDADGKVVAVLVSVGGFLGLGETTVAIGLRHLVINPFDPDHLDVRTSLSREAIEQAARFDPHESPVSPSDRDRK